MSLVDDRDMIDEEGIFLDDNDYYDLHDNETQVVEGVERSHREYKSDGSQEKFASLTTSNPVRRLDFD